MKKTKVFNISKILFIEAFKKVKANAGAEGVDEETIDDFEKDITNNLYKLWNRMSSGSYFPPSVKGVNIPKKTGGCRTLGIPTVGDRVCQMVVRTVLERIIEPKFLKDSYGYRPNKSALEAIGITRSRCWSYDWVVEFDIRSLFDTIQHELLMKAIEKHTRERWILLYIKRWLQAPMKKGEETIESKQGIPQGGVISPLLSNVFMHYVFDLWMEKK